MHLAARSLILYVQMLLRVREGFSSVFFLRLRKRGLTKTGCRADAADPSMLHRSA